MSEIKKQIIELAHSLESFVVSGEGNVSGKDENSFVIKASGTNFKTLSESDLIVCDFTNKQLDNFDKKPSMEIGFHSWFLNFEHVKFVAHTHPKNVLKIMCTEYGKLFAKKRLFPDQVVRNGISSCFVPYETPGNKLNSSIQKAVTKFQLKHNILPKIILLQNHGLISVGTSIRECQIATEMCEKAAEVFLGALTFNSVKFLSKSQINDILNCPMEIYRKNIVQ